MRIPISIIFVSLSFSLILHSQTQNKVLLKNSIKNQMRFAPVDSSFLYETRYIPNILKKNSFLPEALSQEMIKQKLKKDIVENQVEKKEKQVKKKSFKVDSSTWIKILFLIVIIVIFTLYKLKLKKNTRGPGSRF